MSGQIRLFLSALLFLTLSCTLAGRGPHPAVEGSRQALMRGLSCKPVSGCFLEARTAYAQGDPAKAIRLLKDSLAQDPAAPWKGRILTLLGRVLEASQDPEAIWYYRQALNEIPELGDYILFRLGDLYLKQSQALAAAEALEELYRRYPESLLKAQALYRAAEAYIQAQEFSEAMASIELFLRLYPDHPEMASALYLMGKAHLNRYEITQAVELFKRVVWQYPQEPEADFARTELEALSADGISVAPLTPAEWLQQAEALYRAARYREAVQAFQQGLVSGLDPVAREEANLYLGISLVQLRQWPEAMKVFESLLKNRPGGDVAGEALSWFGRAALRQGDLEKLQWVHETLKTAYPDRSERAKALWYLVFYYESKDQSQKAIQACRELIKAFPQDSLAQEAYWRMGWIHYKNGQIEGALKVFDELLEQHPNTAFRPQALYWRAKALERQDRPEEAQEAYKRLCQDHGRSFYCHRTKNRLDTSPPQEQAFKTPVSNVTGQEELFGVEGSPEEPTPQILTADQQYRKAWELMQVAFSAEAAQELNTMVLRYLNNRPALLFLARQLSALGAHDQSLRLIRLYFQETLEKGTPPMSKDFWKLAYPMGMMDEIARLMDPNRLDPYLVASIIREESMYDPKAVSRAGAMGLMQVLPETGRWVASRLGFTGFQSDQLFDPELNIKLGSWYLASLYEEFKGDLVFTIAAYNAGPDAVTEWIQKNNYQDMDEFIEQIPYSETRLYVKRVLRSYYEYVILNLCSKTPSSEAAFLDKVSCPEYS